MKLMALQLTGQIATEVGGARLSMLCAPNPGGRPDAGVAGAAGDGAARFRGALPGAPRRLPRRPRRRRRCRRSPRAAWPAPRTPSPPRPAAPRATARSWPTTPISASPRRRCGISPASNCRPAASSAAPSRECPAILVGRGEALGWGLTTAYLDDLDLYVEQLNPDNAEEYRTPEGWKPFATRRAIVDVSGRRAADPDPALDRERPRASRASHFDLAAITPPGHVMSMAWTALSGRRHVDDQPGIGLMRAASDRRGDRRRAGYRGAGADLTLADRDGRSRCSWPATCPGARPPPPDRGADARARAGWRTTAGRA